MHSIYPVALYTPGYTWPSGSYRKCAEGYLSSRGTDEEWAQAGERNISLWTHGDPSRPCLCFSFLDFVFVFLIIAIRDYLSRAIHLQRDITDCASAH